MKKKYVSLLLTAALSLLLLFPAAIPAAASDGTHHFEDFTSDCSGNGWSWSYADRNLRLSGADLSDIYLPAGTSVELVGYNRIDGELNCSAGNLTVGGSGMLDCGGICADNEAGGSYNVTVDGGSLNLHGGITCGILTVRGGSIIQNAAGSQNERVNRMRGFLQTGGCVRITVSGNCTALYLSERALDVTGGYLEINSAADAAGYENRTNGAVYNHGDGGVIRIINSGTGYAVAGGVYAAAGVTVLSTGGSRAVSGTSMTDDGEKCFTSLQPSGSGDELSVLTSLTCPEIVFCKNVLRSADTFSGTLDGTYGFRSNGTAVLNNCRAAGGSYFVCGSGTADACLITGTLTGSATLVGAAKTGGCGIRTENMKNCFSGILVGISRDGNGIRLQKYYDSSATLQLIGTSTAQTYGFSTAVSGILLDTDTADEKKMLVRGILTGVGSDGILLPEGELRTTGAVTGIGTGANHCGIGCGTLSPESGSSVSAVNASSGSFGIDVNCINLTSSEALLGAYGGSKAIRCLNSILPDGGCYLQADDIGAAYSVRDPMSGFKKAVCFSDRLPEYRTVWSITAPVSGTASIRVTCNGATQTVTAELTAGRKTNCTFIARAGSYISGEIQMSSVHPASVAGYYLYQNDKTVNVRLYLCGDGNHDDTVDIRDLIRAKRWLADEDESLFPYGYESIDANADGSFDAGDLAAIRAIILGKYTAPEQPEDFTYTYLLNSRVVSWTAKGGVIYAAGKEQNRVMRIDTAVRDEFDYVSLPGVPAELRIFDRKLYVSVPALKTVRIYDPDSLELLGTIRTENEVGSFCVYDDALFYAEYDQQCRIFRKELSTGEETQIKRPIGANHLFYEPALEINPEEGLLYIGESGSTGCVLFYYGIDDLTYKSEFRKDNYGYRNGERTLFLCGDQLFWGEFCMNAADPTDLIGQYHNTYTGGMEYVNDRFVCTDRGIFFRNSYELCADLINIPVLALKPIITADDTLGLFAEWNEEGTTYDALICIPRAGWLTE